MTLLAVYQAMLARWTGRRDLAVGTSVVGRDRPELAALIGPLLNTVVIRDQLAAGAASGHCCCEPGRPRWMRSPIRTCRSASWSGSWPGP